MNLPTHLQQQLHQALPDDAAQALLLGRIWLPGTGPVPVVVQGDALLDASSLAQTSSELLARPQAAHELRAALQAQALPVVARVSEVLANSHESQRQPERAWLLAPNDLHAVKASGVTFIASLLERVIEEQARGDASRAQDLRHALHHILGDSLSGIKPGSAQAQEVKALLLQRGAWSQYLEVGIGPDAEIFTKAPVLSAVGSGADVGLHPKSAWNNPEPEIVLAVNPRGEVVGASLGNDVNLRDFEGRSALLLGKAKDNNGSCAIGPFIRLFDEHFTLDHVRQCDIHLSVHGSDHFVFEGQGSLAEISRDPLDLVAQAMGPHHQYPDGMMLFLGTMLAPTQDRHAPGQGFTHEVGDVVTVSTACLGRLVNRVDRSDRIAPCQFGITALMHNLAARRLAK